MSQEQREQLIDVDLAQLGTGLLLWLDGDEDDLEKNIMEEHGILPLLPLEAADG